MTLHAIRGDGALLMMLLRLIALLFASAAAPLFRRRRRRRHADGRQAAEAGPLSSHCFRRD